MNTNNILIGALFVGAYFVYTKIKQSPNGSASNSLTSNSLNRVKATTPSGAAKDATLWSYNQNSGIISINWSKEGDAIGNYTGMSQSDANTQAVRDYNNQFISPWTSQFQGYTADHA